MTTEQRSRSLRINGEPVKIVCNQMIVDSFDETKYINGSQVASYKMYIAGHNEWQEVSEDKLLH